MANANVDALRARLNIVAVIEQYTPLRKVSPAEWRGKDHPSLAVDEAKQLYFWHSQEEGGDVFAWVMKRESCDFRSALERLTHQAMSITPLTRPEPEPVKPLPAPGKVEQFALNMAMPEARAAWAREGFTADDCEYWRFGYTPDLWGMGAALVIPNVYRGEVVCVKYRILGRDKDKYRSEGPAQLFNRDMLEAEADVLLVEGEKKAAHLTQRGLIAVGLPGVGNFKEEWLPAFEDKRITLALDETVNPYALDYPRQIARVAECLRVMWMPVKPDDFFVKYGGTTTQFIDMQRAARIWRRPLQCTTGGK